MTVVEFWEEPTMSSLTRQLQRAALLALSLSLAACARNEAAPAPMQAPQVSVAKVISQQINEFDQFTGRIEPIERVDIRPRVSGYIASVDFAEGREVNKGD